ncbi:MAG: dTDP-glucose 4,6-dehydratase [Gemmatimonadales bacterium]
MSNLLITGGAGFIGANFTHYWLQKHPDDSIIVLDALTYAGNLASLGSALTDQRLKFVQGDIGTPGLVESLLREHAISRLVHFAAESHVDRSIAGPDPFLQTNVLGTHQLLKAARTVWLDESSGVNDPRFHHISTDEVYGSLGPDDPPFTEVSPCDPSSPYAASKAASDHLVRAYHRTYGLPVSVTNCSNNYGPYQHPEKLIPLVILHVLEGKPLPIYGDGLQVRDWLHVHDHCRAIEQALLQGRAGETYNVGGQSESANLNLVRQLAAILDQCFAKDPLLSRRYPRSPAGRAGGAASLITHVADRPGHDRRYATSNSKIERELGFRPEETLESGLRHTVTWYLEHEDWWRGTMDGRYREWMKKQYGKLVSF